MRVLTLKEPWAGLIISGVKKIETRSWKTNYRGELFIHAGLLSSDNQLRISLISESTDIPFPSHGFIIGKCNLVDCFQITDEYAKHMERQDYVNYLCGDYAAGRYAWVLESPMKITPIKATGKQGLWRY